MAKSNSPASIEFLFTELQTGLTFASVALAARPDQTEKRKLVTERAREAHDSFLKYRERVALSEDQIRKLDDGLAKLRTVLRSLGETV